MKTDRTNIDGSIAHGTRATQHRNNLASPAAAPHVSGSVGKQAILMELETGIGAFFSVIRKLGNCCGCLLVMLAIVGTASAGSRPFRTTPNPDKVEVVTSDVEHFWRAFDRASKMRTDERPEI